MVKPPERQTLGGFRKILTYDSLENYTMLVRRGKRDKGYTVLDNQVIRDPELTFKATGLLCFLLSFPDDWQVNTKHLEGSKKDGESSIRSGIKELIERGYMRRERVTGPDGRVIRWEIVVYETPLKPGESKGKTTCGKSTTGKSTCGKSGDIVITDLTKTDLPITELTKNSGGDLTRTEEQDHDDDFFTELQPIAQTPLPPEPQAPKPEPQIISPSVNSIQDLQGQGEAPPVPPPPPKVPPRNPSLAPNPSARVGNGTPWAPLAPWTSREEYDAFKAWLVAANPGKPEGYIHAILIRVEKGDFDNRSWQGFKAGSSPDNQPSGISIPKEWEDAVQAIFEGLGSNPFYATREADRWAESYQQFRRLYSYDSKGQPVRWPAADSWALAQAKAILAAAYPAAS